MWCYGCTEGCRGWLWGGELSHMGEAAACSACQEGYYLDNADRTCKPCQGNCATCSGAGATNCEACKIGYYLKGDKSCSNTCDNNQYADPESRTCKLCTTIDQSCTACKYNATISKPQCTTCVSSKKVRTALDGTTTCVDDAGCTNSGTHFLSNDKSKCLLCSDITTDASTAGNTGVANCKTCQKAADNQNPTCSACLDGYFFSQGSCSACGANCATCTSAAINDCTACLPGYFLKTDGSAKECVPCDNVEKGGREGCATCTFSTSLTCSSCKPNYRQSGSNPVTCTRTCGGTAGPAGRSWWAAMEA